LRGIVPNQLRLFEAFSIYGGLFEIQMETLITRRRGVRGEILYFSPRSPRLRARDLQAVANKAFT
jgi:hypothetical protein